MDNTSFVYNAVYTGFTALREGEGWEGEEEASRRSICTLEIFFREH